MAATLRAVQGRPLLQLHSRLPARPKSITVPQIVLSLASGAVCHLHRLLLRRLFLKHRTLVDPGQAATKARQQGRDLLGGALSTASVLAWQLSGCIGSFPGCQHHVLQQDMDAEP